jgi:GGDEF domain-containing protein
MPRLTKRVFRDLAIWMVGCGLLAGIVFPFFVIPLGVPPATSLTPVFFAATLGAGLAVGVVNFALARLVAGRRVRDLATRMREVKAVIDEGTFSGDWSGCDPKRCAVPVDSDDELGDVARSFNRLLEALARSHEIATSVRSFSETLTSQLELRPLAENALDQLLVEGGAEAGAVFVLVDDELLVAAERHLASEPPLFSNDELRSAVLGTEIVRLARPAEVAIEGPTGPTPAAAVLVVPFAFRHEPLGAIVVASSWAFETAAERVFALLRGQLGLAVRNAIAHQRLEQLGAVDPVTNAYNDRFGRVRLHEELVRAGRRHLPCSILALEAVPQGGEDEASRVAAADRLYAATAAAARRTLRAGDALVHAGDGRFWVIAPALDGAAARAEADALVRAVDAIALPWIGTLLTLSARSSVATFPRDGRTEGALLAAAGAQLGWPDPDTLSAGAA